MIVKKMSLLKDIYKSNLENMSISAYKVIDNRDVPKYDI
jgi:hypothetical protein